MQNPVEPPCGRSGGLGQDLRADLGRGVDLLEGQLTAGAESGLVAEVAPGLAGEVAQLPRVEFQGARGAFFFLLKAFILQTNLKGLSQKLAKFWSE